MLPIEVVKYGLKHTLWGGKETDDNGKVIEELMDNKGIVCLNNGVGTRINVRNGVESALDLTLVTDSLAGVCTWEVKKQTTVGSDHYPIITGVGLTIEKYDTDGVRNWAFHKADWEEFKEICEKEMAEIDIKEGVDQLNMSVGRVMIEAAERSIKRKEGKNKKRMVPWWNKECGEAIKARNKAFRGLKRNHSFENLMEYKRSQANVRKSIKSARRTCWRNFCNSVGRETEVGQIWGMIKRMNGIKREYGYPVLKEGEIIAVREEEKVEMLAKAFVKVHSSGNITEEGKRGREGTVAENEVLMQEEEENEDLLNKIFTMTEMNRALRKTKMTAPGKDQICYIMINNLSESSKEVLLELYNRVWREGKLPESWKEAVIVPIPKPGKDNSNPENYRPIALTSNICKIMEKMINEILSYYMESRGYLSRYQSGFRKGRNTMDPTLCLEHEIRKAQINKESVVAVFFDIEKA